MTSSALGTARLPTAQAPAMVAGPNMDTYAVVLVACVAPGLQVCIGLVECQCPRVGDCPLLARLFLFLPTNNRKGRGQSYHHHQHGTWGGLTPMHTTPCFSLQSATICRHAVSSCFVFSLSVLGLVGPFCSPWNSFLTWCWFIVVLTRLGRTISPPITY